MKKSAKTTTAAPITITYSFTAAEWQKIEKKAKLADCSAMALLNECRDLLANTADLVPLWLPQGIVNKLWKAVEPVEGDADEIGEIVLGELVKDRGRLAAMVASKWPAEAVA